MSFSHNIYPKSPPFDYLLFISSISGDAAAKVGANIVIRIMQLIYRKFNFLLNIESIFYRRKVFYRRKLFSWRCFSITFFAPWSPIFGTGVRRSSTSEGPTGSGKWIIIERRTHSLPYHRVGPPGEEEEEAKVSESKEDFNWLKWIVSYHLKFYFHNICLLTHGNTPPSLEIPTWLNWICQMRFFDGGRRFWGKIVGDKVHRNFSLTCGCLFKLTCLSALQSLHLEHRLLI